MPTQLSFEIPVHYPGYPRLYTVVNKKPGILVDKDKIKVKPNSLFCIGQKTPAWQFSTFLIFPQK